MEGRRGRWDSRLTVPNKFPIFESCPAVLPRDGALRFHETATNHGALCVERGPVACRARKPARALESRAGRRLAGATYFRRCGVAVPTRSPPRAATANWGRPKFLAWPRCPNCAGCASLVRPCQLLADPRNSQVAGSCSGPAQRLAAFSAIDFLPCIFSYSQTRDAPPRNTETSRQPMKHTCAGRAARAGAWMLTLRRGEPMSRFADWCLGPGGTGGHGSRFTVLAPAGSGVVRCCCCGSGLGTLDPAPHARPPLMVWHGMAWRHGIGKHGNMAKPRTTSHARSSRPPSAAQPGSDLFPGSRTHPAG